MDHVMCGVLLVAPTLPSRQTLKTAHAQAKQAAAAGEAFAAAKEASAEGCSGALLDFSELLKRLTGEVRVLSVLCGLEAQIDFQGVALVLLDCRIWPNAEQLSRVTTAS